MRDKISFLILTHQGSATRQFVTSKRNIKILSLSIIGILMAGMVSIAYIIYDYRQLNKTLSEVKVMEALVASQQEEIFDQRDEIGVVVEKINTLKDELFALKEYEAQVRAIADIKDEKKGDDKLSPSDKTHFGVGGSQPEDIDPDINLNKKHSHLIDAMHQQIDQLALTSTQQSDGIKDLLKELQEKQRQNDCTPSIRPVRGQTTSTFGYRRSAFTKKREYHKGYDIGAPKGTAIVATADGKVKFAGRDGSFGKIIVIDHGYGYTTRYAHADKILKKRGERVKKGDVIARVGNTGRSTGPHVHYEVLKKGAPVNPKKYFLN